MTGLPNVLKEQEQQSYGRGELLQANRMKLSFLDRISLPNDFKIALCLVGCFLKTGFNLNYKAKESSLNFRDHHSAQRKGKKSQTVTIS